MIFNGSYQYSVAAADLENGFDEKCCRAFSVSSSNSGNRQLFRGTLVEIAADAVQGSSSMRDHGPGDALTGRFFWGVSNDRQRSRRDRAIDELIAVAALSSDRDKHIARLNAARVVLHGSDTGIAALGQYFRPLQEVFESH